MSETKEKCMNVNVRCFNFEIIIGGYNVKSDIESKLPKITEWLDTTFKDYMCQFEYDHVKKFMLRICGHIKWKIFHSALEKRCKKALGGLRLEVKVLVGQHGYDNRRKEFGGMECCGKPWKKGETYVCPMAALGVDLGRVWKRMEQCDTLYLPWIEKFSDIDVNGKFVEEGVKNHLFVHVGFRSIDGLMADIRRGEEHSLYVIDFRKAKLNWEMMDKRKKEKIESALSNIRDGKISEGRIQNAANVVCISDDECPNDIFYEPWEFNVARKRKMEEQKEQRSTKRAKM